jgi:hypothetical protein
MRGEAEEPAKQITQLYTSENVVFLVVEVGT